MKGFARLAFCIWILGAVFGFPGLAARGAPPDVPPAAGKRGPVPAAAANHIIDLQHPFRFERLTVEDGLSNSTVLAIVQDQAGFMWFATADGLNRYDGYEFTVFRHDARDPHSLSHNNLVALIESRDGSLWVGSDPGGLNRFDPATETFTHYRHNPDDPASLPNDSVWSLYEDEQGFIWAGTRNGLGRLDPRSGRFTNFLPDPNNPRALSNPWVIRLYGDAEGTLWAGTRSGLNRYDPATGDFTVYQHDPQNPTSLPENLGIWDLLEDSQGVFWVATRGGLSILDRRTGRFTTFRHDPNNPNSLSDDHVWHLLEDHSGNLWIATERGGLNLFDRQTGHFFAARHDPNHDHTLSHDDLFWLIEDRSGVLWIGSRRGGVNKLSPSLQRFSHYHHVAGNALSLSADNVTGIWVSPTNELYLGTQGGGLNRYSARRDRLTVYRHNPDDPFSLPGDSILAVYGDETAVWAGTQGDGLARLDPQTGRFTTFQNNPDDPDSLASNFITSLAPAGEGRLWVGTLGFGLDLFDPATGRAVHYTQDQGLAEDTIYALAVESNGGLYIGTARGGLSRYDPRTGRFTNFAHDSDDPNSLIDNTVNTLAFDASGNLWAGTSGGLSQFKPSQGIFVSYTVREGLPSDTIYGLAVDGRGHVWASTGKGIADLDPASGAVYSYDAADGLQSNQFNQYSAHRSAAGEIFFGGPNGMNAFFPDLITYNRYPPEVVFTGLELFNERVPAGSELLPQALDRLDALVLKPGQTVFTLRFAAADYQAPAKNLYQYHLEGFDKDWSPPGLKRSATYTNLNPGTYIFQVRAANNDGQWMEAPRNLTITVLPYWWQTAWFQGAAVLGGLALTFGAVQLRVRNVRSRNRDLERRVVDRTHSLTLLNAQLHEEIQRRIQAEKKLREANTRLQAQVEEIGALRDSLREQAIRDPLTGLFNRRYMEEALEQELCQARRQGYPVGVLMMDIDHFKHFNDAFGHKAGDQVLQALSAQIDCGVRCMDIACRYGGEEFVIIMPTVDGSSSLHRAEQIRQTFQATVIDGQSEPIQASLSIGVALFPLHAQNGEDLLDRADQALYTAKARGRNCVAIFEEKS